MPTGYTAAVADGKITEFKDFALQCARAFGAAIHLRDEPLSTGLTERPAFGHHTKALAQAKADLAEFEALTEEQLAAKYEAYCRGRQEQDAEDERRRAAIKDRYEAMMEKARRWEPPTTSHQELKKFMVEQLAEGLRWDVATFTPPPVREFAEWKSETLATMRRSIDYHTKQEAESLQRNEEANQ